MEFENKFKSIKRVGNKLLFTGIVILVAVMIISPDYVAGAKDFADQIGNAWILWRGTMFLLSVLLITLGAIPHFLWLVPTGWVGFQAWLGKVRDKSYSDGLHFKVPFITDTYLTDLRVQTRQETDTKKVLTRNNVTLEYTLTYQVDKNYAHLLFRYFGERYFETHLHQWIDAVFDTFVSRLTYPQLQTQKEQIEAIASALIRQEIDLKCGDASKADGSHIGYHCKIKSDDTIAVDLDEDGVTEDIPKLELEEWTEDDDPGVNFFKSFDLKINKVTFEPGYEKSRAEVAIARSNVKKAELEKEAAAIKAEALKIAVEKEGEAKAAAYQAQVAALGGDPKVLAQFELADAIRRHNGTIMLGGSATPIINP